MFSKPLVRIIVVAIVCSMLVWGVLVVLMSDEPSPGNVVVAAIFSLFLWVYVFFAGLILRDTIRRRGMWGINFFKRVVCPHCGMHLRRGITFLSWKEICYGGWTCHECGLELNQWGRPWKEQKKALAKWVVLHAADDANERKPPSQCQEERIHKGNDQTKRGEVP